MIVTIKSAIKQCYWTLFWFLIVIPSSAFAGIPSAPNIAGAQQGDFILTLPAVIKEVAKWLIPILYIMSAGALIGALVYKYLEAKEHNKWGGFVTTLIVGVILYIFIVILLNQLKNAIGVG